MSELEGRILVDMHLSKQGLGANIDSSRPVLASRVFEGRDIQAVLKMVPLIYSLCGQAQSVAAVRAIESAQETPASDDVEKGRELLIRLESLREHLWRIFIDWPQLLGKDSHLALLAPVNQRLTALQKSLNADGVLTLKPGQQDWEPSGVQMEDWAPLNRLISQLMFDPSNDQGQVFPFLLLDQLVEKGWAELGAYSIASLKPLDSTFLATVLRGNKADAFIAQPHWSGQVYETGPFSRMRNHEALQRARQTFGDGVYTRFAARILEVIDQLTEITRLFEGDFKVERLASRGISQVEAVRGLLAHCVDLEGDTVKRYRILAPTEWNFHADGVVKRMLARLESCHEDELIQRVKLLIQAVDPCVGFDVSIKRQAA